MKYKFPYFMNGTRASDITKEGFSFNETEYRISMKIGFDEGTLCSLILFMDKTRVTIYQIDN